ncbi:helix-turn-helix domain-containing protein [Microbacterium sp. 10M-3C3]|jgi:AraC-like DNA-binding protein|uniref:helix-turn-helix domain-containing protein n=1 Tax=Microbacterium sp. 10M-3C3 TaxID=2483401 RepID=UPI000F640326|nr:helix-turn-helix domain-containing protein [Microbacterium sp. 10M-3C3]
MSAAHRHDDLELNLADADLAYVTGGRSVTIPAHRVALFWAGRPHQLVGGEGVTTTWITVPMKTAMAWPVVRAAVADLVSGDVVLGAADIAVTRHRGHTWARELRDPDAAVRRPAMLEVEALVTRLLGAREPSNAVAPADARAASDRAGTMARVVADRFREPLRVADVAHVVHLHPQTAARVFRESVGVSIPDYLRQCRIAEAQRLLMQTDLAVDAVGQRSGFGSSSTFHAAFTAATGTTPLAFRRERQT